MKLTKDKATAHGEPELVQRVRSALADVPDVKEKRMFGSVGFMVSGKLCVTARAERIMCRIDPVDHDAALQRKGCRTVVMKGRVYRGYVYVEAAAVSTKRALTYWVGLALRQNESLSS